MKQIALVGMLVVHALVSAAQGDYCAITSSVSPNWVCLGPFNNYYGITEYNGRVDCVWGDPKDLGHILASGNMGGLWETNDTGHNWHCLTDGVTSGNGYGQIPGAIAPLSLSVSPVDSRIIYMQIGMSRSTEKSWGYNLGMIYSLNGGKTWQSDERYDEVLGRKLFSEFAGLEHVGACFVPEEGWLFAYSGKQLIVKKDVTKSKWKNISPGGLPEGFVFNGIDYSKKNPGKLVLCGDVREGGSPRVCVYDIKKRRWSISTPELSATTDTITALKYLSVSGADTVFMLVSGHSTYGFSYLIKGALGDTHFQVVNQAVGYKWLTVSPVDQNIIYAAHAVSPFYVSKDGGSSFQPLSRYGRPRRPGCHADPRCLSLYKATVGGRGDILLGGTDGGIVMKLPGWEHFQSITGDSICITQFYSLSNTEVDEDYMVAGAQDHGIMSYIARRAEPWDVTYGSTDGFLVKMTDYDSVVAYGGVNLPGMKAFQIKDTNVIRLGLWNPNDMADGCMYCYHNPIQRPIVFDATNTAYVGYRKVWKKKLNETKWYEAFNNHMPVPDNLPRKVGDIVLAETDSNIAYVLYREAGASGSLDLPVNRKLFVSKNAATPEPLWENITPGRIQWWRINDIDINQDNPGSVWVAYGDLNHGLMNTDIREMSGRVEYSPDYGKSWYDVSRGLPDMPVNKILYQKGSNGILYAATDIGVYRCDFSSFDISSALGYGVMWECFHEGLPDCQITDMEFNYKAGKLRVATFGRGIWETKIP